MGDDFVWATILYGRQAIFGGRQLLVADNFSIGDDYWWATFYYGRQLIFGARPSL